ncbi:carbohydrate binding domain-containing protein [Cohnella rhizosphaerae]|uniref:Uncharacterized protein n=1 Tax=Cohnella rhizosphaerae TaxID=1457232 RepID=A0A9X4QUE2_9BACL|nr:hypothetical protein [Cohnella rhizosphaerae]MDG0810387.1 hypothetical protein [Cohnella rhizosphaerae]
MLSFRGRTTRPDAAGTVEIYNETATASLAAVAFSGTAWKKQSIVFTAPAASGQTLKLRALMPPTSTGEVGFVDVFSLKPLEYTEAAGWTRDAGTSLAAAHRSNDAVRFPADDAGLELVHDGTSDPIVYQEIYNYAPNARYGISFAGLASAGAAGEVRIYDRTASTVLGSWTFNNSDSFATAYESFMTPAADHELLLEVGIPSGAAGDTVWLDSFKLGQYWEQMVQEGIILTPILRFANAVKEDEELHAAYLTKAEQYTEFAADNMVHKWDPYWRQLTGTDGSDNGTGLYIMPPGFSTEVAPGRSLPHNQYLAYARMLYLLYDATEGDAAYAADRALYWSRANDMTRAFQGTVAAHPLNASMNTDAYLWHYWDPMGSWDEGHYFSYTLEDLSHAGLTMTGALEAYAHGQVFTRLDMERFSRTFTDIMWNQSLTEPVLSWQNSRAPSVTADKERMHQMSGWTQFIPFNPEVRDIADAVCEVNACMPTVAADLAKWSSNKLSNPGFESADADDPTLPDRWTRYLSTSATAGLTNSDSAIGDRSLSIASGSTWQIVEQRLAQYEPNTPYLIEFMGKRYGTTGFRAQVYDYTASTIVGQAYFNDTDWARHSFTVTMPEEGHDVRVRLYNLSVSPSGQSIAFDDVHARPLLALGEVANAGFETADRWDAALPRYWTRGSATPANNAVLDSSTRSAGRSSLKLVSAATGDSQRMSYLWRGYVPGAAYDVSFDGKVDGAAGGLLQIIDKTANAVLVSQSVSAASWTTMAATFTAPGAHDHVLEIVLTHSDPAQPGTFWADQIRVSAG